MMLQTNKRNRFVGVFFGYNMTDCIDKTCWCTCISSKYECNAKREWMAKCIFYMILLQMGNAMLPSAVVAQNVCISSSLWLNQLDFHLCSIM